jgi:hypothetical protein
MQRAVGQHGPIDVDERLMSGRDSVEANAKHYVGHDLPGRRAGCRTGLYRPTQNQIVSEELFTPVENRVSRDKSVHRLQYRPMRAATEHSEWAAAQRDYGCARAIFSSAPSTG